VAFPDGVKLSIIVAGADHFFGKTPASESGRYKTVFPIVPLPKICFSLLAAFSSRATFQPARLLG
jgi:hypothetical protein